MGYQDEDELSEEGFLEMLADYEKLEKLQAVPKAPPFAPAGGALPGGCGCGGPAGGALGAAGGPL